MNVLLRLLLAVCLVLTALPSPAAGDADTAARAAQDADTPPCHTPEPAQASHAHGQADGHGCCDPGTGGCDGDCGCLHVAGVPITLTAAVAQPAPAGPPVSAGSAGLPPRLARPVRPPIA